MLVSSLFPHCFLVVSFLRNAKKWLFPKGNKRCFIICVYTFTFHLGLFAASLNQLQIQQKLILIDDIHATTEIIWAIINIIYKTRHVTNDMPYTIGRMKVGKYCVDLHYIHLQLLPSYVRN